MFLAAGTALDAAPHRLVTEAAAAGFDGLGLRVSGEHRLEARQIAGLRHLLDQTGVVISEVEVIRIGDTTIDPHAIIDMAAALGAASVLVVSDLPDEAATLDALYALARRAHDVGVTLGLEYMAWTTPSTPAAAVDMARQCGGTVVCDVLHHRRVGAGVSDLAGIVEAGVLGWVQICDAPLDAPVGGVDGLLHEARHDRLPPAMGQLPVATWLTEVPNDIPLSVEVQSDRLKHAMDLASRVALLHEAAQRWNTIGYRPK